MPLAPNDYQGDRFQPAKPKFRDVSCSHHPQTSLILLTSPRPIHTHILPAHLPHSLALRVWRLRRPVRLRPP